jgi:predicted enzyme related to lactoylglutathione lyase
MSSPTSAQPIVHFDIAGPNDQQLRRFYGDLFGWTIDDRGPGYALVTTPNLRGAIAEAEQPSVSFAVGVADLNAALAAAIACGATVTMPATDNGWVTKAQIADPCGNAITLVQT